ncbi:MAG: ATP-grasp domain-containing protein [Elusimicrobiota bacterium]|nr:ATP-grasp domain-containing protein [Elusimicrobiota bacterium]
MKRPLSALLTAALLLGTPGLPAWQALAASGKVTTGSGRSNTGPGGQAGAQAGVGTAGPASIGVQPIALTGSFSLNTAAPAPILDRAAVPLAAPAPSLPASPATDLRAAADAPKAPRPADPAGPAAAAPVAGAPVVSPVAAALLAPNDAPGAPETVASALEEAGRSLAAPDADPAAVLDRLFAAGVKRADIDRVLAERRGSGAKSLRRLAPFLATAGASAAAAPVPGTPGAAAAPKKSLLRKIKDAFDVSQYNSSEKAYIAGQAVFLLAISVYLASLPLLVQALTGDTALLGAARTVHFWVFGGASLFAGAVVSRSPMKRVLVGAAGARAAIFGSIGLFTLMGGLPWAAFLVLVGANALIVSMNHLVDIDTGGAAKVFNTDKKIEKAGYTYDFIFFSMMMVIPPLLGMPLDWLTATYGSHVGAGAGFAVFGALMAIVALIYGRKVKTIGEAIVEAPLRGLRDAVARSWKAVRTFLGILRDIPARQRETWRIIDQNKAIKARLLMATLENFMEDALFAVIIPYYAIEMLGLGMTGNGVVLSAITAGGLLASTLLVSRVQEWSAKYGTYRVLQALTVFAALAFIPTIGLWAAPSIAVAVPAVFLLKLMLTPLRSRMRALLQVEIKNDPRAAPHADAIYSQMTTFEVFAAGLGGLFFSWMLISTLPVTLPFGLGAFVITGGAPFLASVFGSLAAMKVVTLFMLGMGVVYFLGLRWVKSQLDKPTIKVHASPEGNEEKMLAQLAQSLQENGLPPYKTATVTEAADPLRPTVVIMSPASRHKIAIAREGGRQSPGDVHLVLDASWAPQETYADGRTRILVRKAVVFDAEGQATLVEYAQPKVVTRKRVWTFFGPREKEVIETPQGMRRAGYFANFFTLGANGRTDGHVFENNHAAPQSNSLQLEVTTNDKLGTRLLMAARGVTVPVTLAFALPLHTLASSAGRTAPAAVAAAGQGVATVSMPGAEAVASRRVNGSVADFASQVVFAGKEVPIAGREDGATAWVEDKVEFRVKAYGPGFAGGAVERIVNARGFGLHAAVFQALTDPAMTADGGVTIEAVGVKPGVEGMRTTLRVEAGDAPWLGGARTPIREHIDAFLDAYGKDEVVIKPSGSAFHSGYGVEFFKKDRRAAAYAHALQLSGDVHMTEDGAVLVDGRVDSAPLFKGGRRMETTLRVLASRTPWDGFATSGVFARVGPHGKPTTAEAADPRDNATVEPWESLLREWKAAGLLDDASARELDAEVRALGPAAFAAIAAEEDRRRDFYRRRAGEPFKAQTDLIGLDVMIERRVGADGRVKLVPVVIEVNDHDSGGQYNLDLANRGTDKVGEHSRLWMATALQRARREALEGKRIVMVGAGYRGKRFIFERAAQLKVEVVLVAPRDAFVEELLRDGLVTEFIEADNSKPAEARAAALKKLRRSIRKNGRLDGITTSWEDDVPLAAALAEDLGLPYHSQAAAAAVRSKAKTRDILNEADVSKVAVFRLRNPLDADARLRAELKREFLARLDEIGFPAVLKPQLGAAAIGPMRINSLDDALAVYDKVVAVVRPEVDEIFKQGTDLQLETYLDGQEYDIDVTMIGGRVTAATITDNKPTREPYFQATGSVSPSRGMTRAQQREAIDQAVKAAQVLGLTDGVLHIEGKYTSRGPRIIEANGRMGGEYVWDWNKTVWGLDLVEEGLMIAAGIKGKPFLPAEPLTHLDGDFVMTEGHGVVDELDVDDAVRRHPGFHSFTRKFAPGDRVSPPVSGTNRLGMIVAKGRTPDEAAKNLRELNALVRVRLRPDATRP